MNFQTKFSFLRLQQKEGIMKLVLYKLGCWITADKIENNSSLPNSENNVTIDSDLLFVHTMSSMDSRD